jgi:hypothetical protein
LELAIIRKKNACIPLPELVEQHGTGSVSFQTQGND